MSDSCEHKNIEFLCVTHTKVGPYTGHKCKDCGSFISTKGYMVEPNNTSSIVCLCDDMCPTCQDSGFVSFGIPCPTCKKEEWEK